MEFSCVSSLLCCLALASALDWMRVAATTNRKIVGGGMVSITSEE
jgi:hypothetical protein